MNKYTVSAFLAFLASASQLPIQGQQKDKIIFEKEFDWAQAEIARQFSVIAYCGYKQYDTHVFTDALEGFEWYYTMYSGWGDDTEGYMGYLPSDNSIWLSFKGSSSIQNWITNIDTIKSKYNEWPECDCKVHAGFEGAANSIKDDMLVNLAELVEKHPTAQIKTTGHSLGGALAQLTAMTIQANGYDVA